jgi:hypothetical protein
VPETMEFPRHIDLGDRPIGRRTARKFATLRGSRMGRLAVTSSVTAGTKARLFDLRSEPAACGRIVDYR